MYCHLYLKNTGIDDFCPTRQENYEQLLNWRAVFSLEVDLMVLGIKLKVFIFVPRILQQIEMKSMTIHLFARCGILKNLTSTVSDSDQRKTAATKPEVVLSDTQ